MKIDIDGTSRFTRWLERLLVAPLLLYRRARYGYAFRRIRFSQPKYAKVDPAEYHRLRKYLWFTINGTRTFYAVRRKPIGTSAKHTVVRMHRQIVKPRKGRLVDHINQDGLDNRTANLREATSEQNMANRAKTRTARTSKYKGVCLRKGIAKRKWRARINVSGKEIHLGSFATEIEAAKAYDRAAAKHHAQFAYPNFPNQKKLRPALTKRLWSCLSRLIQLIAPAG